ncbi:MAG: flagellar basal body rod protein FlgC [bacterium]|nr:flagellar basal body rod protein FlgC [bacterium]MCP5067353.1 flagellar basal body rod protein FlgC [bacterium]
MKISEIIDIGVSGVLAQRARMAATASNMANAQTTRTAEGGPYRRRDPVFQTSSVGGPFSDRLSRAVRKVDVSRIEVDQRPAITRFDPGHPDANAEGYVALPRVNVVEELSNMMSASRSYQANLLILRKAREMARAALQLGG